MDDQTPKEGLPLYNNAALEIKYSEALRTLVLRMVNSTNDELSALFNRKYAEKYFNFPESQKQNKNTSLSAKLLLSMLFLRFKKVFGKEAKLLAKNTIEGIEKYSNSVVTNSLSALAGRDVKIPQNTVNVKNTRQALIAENESLIQSLPDQYFTNITGLVMRSISNNLVDEIPSLTEKQDKIVLRRANTIAVDQTRKAMQSISKQKMVDTGFKRFKWIYTYRSKEPRPSHIRLGGKIFSFDNPPIVNADNLGESPRRGFPGSEINCKCIMQPVGEWEKN